MRPSVIGGMEIAWKETYSDSTSIVSKTVSFYNAEFTMYVNWESRNPVVLAQTLRSSPDSQQQV